MAGVRTAREHFKANYRFSVDNFRLMSAMLLVGIAVIILELLIIAYLLVFTAPQNYYATSSIGGITKLNPALSSRLAKQIAIDKFNTSSRQE